MSGQQPAESGEKPSKRDLYKRILARIVEDNYVEGATEVVFALTDINRVADELGLPRPQNVGDLPYSFKFRADLPDSIAARAPAGLVWIVRDAGRSRYGLYLVDPAQHPVNIFPNPLAPVAKLPDATPGVIATYALNDEQALLAKLRYNRLIDIFTGVTCYSLQNHLRTQIEGEQIETDEVYIGVDRRGAHYVFPVQAKGGRDRLGIVQIEQDVRLCIARFPTLICRPVAAQFMAGNVIALFLFEANQDGITQLAERHYRLVAPEEIEAADLETYRARPLDDSRSA
jgi:hypothetical protein